MVQKEAQTGPGVGIVRLPRVKDLDEAIRGRGGLEEERRKEEGVAESEGNRGGEIRVNVGYVKRSSWLVGVRCAT